MKSFLLKRNTWKVTEVDTNPLKHWLYLLLAIWDFFFFLKSHFPSFLRNSFVELILFLQLSCLSNIRSSLFETPLKLQCTHLPFRLILARVFAWAGGLGKILISFLGLPICELCFSFGTCVATVTLLKQATKL